MSAVEAAQTLLSLPPPKQEPLCCANCGKWARPDCMLPGNAPASALAKTQGGCSYGRLSLGSEYCTGHSPGKPSKTEAVLDQTGEYWELGAEDIEFARSHCMAVAFGGEHVWNRLGFCVSCGSGCPETRPPEDSGTPSVPNFEARMLERSGYQGRSLSPKELRRLDEELDELTHPSEDISFGD
jgi:hypothetical protein